MVLLIANNKATTGSTTLSTTIEIDLSISVVSTLTVNGNCTTSSTTSSSGVSSKSSTESAFADSSSNSSSCSSHDCSSLDGTSSSLLITSTGTISTSSSSSSSSSAASTPVKKSERLLAKNAAKGSTVASGSRGGGVGNSTTSITTSDGISPKTSLEPTPISSYEEGICMWRECSCVGESTANIVDHIQTIHVAPQTKAKGYICLWEGCKVYNKKSSSLSWIERHVLTHGGNRPYRCIFPGCGLSFGSQGALERHVNSHITTTGNLIGTTGHSIARKLDSSPSKTARRKKPRPRKQKLNTGQFVDFFDKRTIEVIKYRLSNSVQIEESGYHSCTFNCQVLSRRTSSHEEPHLLVRWYPRNIFPDEWIPQNNYTPTKLVPFRQLPSEKLRLMFPSMFPPERKEKAKRKWKPKPSELENENGNLVKLVKSEIVEPITYGIESVCEYCNFKSLPSNSECRCIPLDPDWAELLSDQSWS